LAKVEPALIVSGMVRARVVEPLTALIVNEEVPIGAFGATVKVIVLVPAADTEVGEKDAVTPVGKPAAESATFPVKPDR
jgi:hypothetical protein